MNDEKKTRLMAIASWVLPVITLMTLPAITALFPVSDLTDLAAIQAYAILYLGALLGTLAVSLTLSLVARHRAKRLHNGQHWKHATAGLFVSLPLLLCYTAATVYFLLSAI